jgi:hypothetical protein
VVPTTKINSVEGNEVDVPKLWKLLHSPPYDSRPLLHSMDLKNTYFPSPMPQAVQFGKEQGIASGLLGRC